MPKLELSLYAIHTPTIVHYKAEARVRCAVEIAQLRKTFQLSLKDILPL